MFLRVTYDNSRPYYTIFSAQQGPSRAGRVTEHTPARSRALLPGEGPGKQRSIAIDRLQSTDCNRALRIASDRRLQSRNKESVAKIKK